MLSPRRWLVRVSCCVFALAVGVPAVAWADPTPSPSPAPAPVAEVPVSVAGLEAAAVARAAALGRRVVVDGLTTETSVVSANPDGMLTLMVSPRAVRVRRGDGWVSVDTSLVRGPDGRFVSRAVSVDASFSAGGAGPLVVLRAPDGRGVVSSSLPFDLPAPSVAGSTLTYGDVLPDVDLVVEGLVESFTEVLVVKTREALNDPRLAELAVSVSASDGLDVVVAADGGSVVNDQRGRPVFGSPAPSVWDSQVSGAGPRPSATVRAVHAPGLDARVMGVSRVGGVERTDIGLSIPDGVLSSPVFPVFVDPSFGLETQTYVTAWSFSGIDIDEPGQRLKVGNCGWPGCGHVGEQARSFFDVSALPLAPRDGLTATVLGARLAGTQVWNAAGWDTPVELWSAGELGEDVDWPGPVGDWLDEVSTDDAGPVLFESDELTEYVQEAAESDWWRIGFGLISPDEDDRDLWKQFDNQFQLEVDFWFPVPKPTGLSVSPTCRDDVTSSVRPIMRAVSTNEANLYLATQVQFDLVGDEFEERSGWLESATDVFAWQPDADVPDGDYVVKARARSLDESGGVLSGTGSGWSGPFGFTVKGDPPQPPTVSNPSLEQPAGGLPTRFEAGPFTVSSQDPSVIGYSYAFGPDPLPAYSWVYAGNCPVISPDLGAGVTGAGADGTATIDFPWDRTDVGSVSVQAIDAAGNMSDSAVFGFQVGSDNTTSQISEAEDIFADDAGSRHVSDAAWSGGAAVNLTIPAGGTSSAVLGLPEPSAQWQLRVVFTDASTPGARVTPMVNGEPFMSQDMGGGGGSGSFSYEVAHGTRTMSTPVFDSLAGGVPSGPQVTAGLMVECPAGGSECVLGVDRFELVRYDVAAALAAPMPQDAVRAGQDMFYARADDGLLVVDAPGAEQVDAVVDGAAVTAVSDGTGVFGLQLPGGNVTAQVQASAGGVSTAPVMVQATSLLTDDRLAAVWKTGRHKDVGMPSGPVEDLGGGDRRQRFDGGDIYATDGRTFTLIGDVRDTYDRWDGPDGVLGLPFGSPRQVAGGIAQTFQHGAIYSGPDMDAHPVVGDIADRYDAMGGSQDVGFPTGDEQPVTSWSDADGVVQYFEAADIFWSQDTGAWPVHGAIVDVFNDLGGADELGFPTSDEVPLGGGVVQTTERGRLYWSPDAGAHWVQGAILGTYLWWGGR